MKKYLCAAMFAAIITFAPALADEPTSAPTPAPPQSDSPVFPIILRDHVGTPVAMIAADGTIVGDKQKVIDLLKSARAPVTPESVVFALIVHLMTDEPPAK